MTLIRSLTRAGRSLRRRGACIPLRRKCLYALMGVVVVTGVSCSTSGLRPGNPILGDFKWNLSPGLQPTMETMAIAAAVYLVVDPMAPNWRIEETRLPDGSFSLALAMKRFHSGGSGEAIQAVHRRAEELVRERGFLGYQIERYSEGIDSGPLIPRRVAHARIRLLHQSSAAAR